MTIENSANSIEMTDGKCKAKIFFKEAGGYYYLAKYPHGKRRLVQVL
jgi:hypothetical protein